VKTLPFWLVDVFARQPLTGNGLSVFLLDEELPAAAMQRITRELRQFESIFLRRLGGSFRYRSRIFTMEEELEFAGHPIIGAAALLHAELHNDESEARFRFVTAQREIPVVSRREASSFAAEMEQGLAMMGAPLPREQTAQFLRALNLQAPDLAPALPLQVVSTGLPYLIVPIRANLAAARIVARDFGRLLGAVGAKFVYVLDVTRREGRSWDNDGRVEDIATGSAAGPAAAYLVAHGLAQSAETILMRQGRFVDRPSELYAVVRGDSELSVTIRGQVCPVGSGTLHLPEHSLGDGA